MLLQYSEKEASLFDAPEHVALVHCVAEDFKMSAGIAIDFRAKFGNIKNLLNQNKTVGEVAFIKHGKRYIFYLVTKETSTFLCKPTLESLERCLLQLKKECRELNVRNLAMPKIGCGIDQLNWEDVRKKIIDIFCADQMTITVYFLSASEEQKKRKEPAS